jgi:hypothetical protein
MDLDRLYKILTETTISLRKGEPVTTEDSNGIRVTHIYFMPHTDEIAGDDIAKIDMHFIVIGIRKTEAEKNKEALLEVMKGYPDLERFREGLSYIEVGGIIGSQEAAFQLFALGAYLDLWKLITPQTIGIVGKAAVGLAGMGFIMISEVKI